MTNDDFKAWIDRLRLTKRQTCKLLGISEHTLRNYRRGRRAGGRPVPIPEPIAKLCRVLEARHNDGHDVILENTDAL